MIPLFDLLNALAGGSWSLLALAGRLNDWVNHQPLWLRLAGVALWAMVLIARRQDRRIRAQI